MSWITQAQLRRDTPQARQLASQLLAAARWDGSHGLVWTLFSDDPDASRDFLYRQVETGRFLVVSSRVPQAQPEIWETKTLPYAPALTTGDRFGFTLRANPTVSLSRPHRARSHRADVMMEAKRLKGAPLTPDESETAAMAWLLARAPALGVGFDAERCGAGLMPQFATARPPDPETGAPRKTSLTVVDYDGVLTVEDPDRLRSALTGGVGRGKAFGLGLLLLRRLGD